MCVNQNWNEVRDDEGRAKKEGGRDKEPGRDNVNQELCPGKGVIRMIYSRRIF